MQSSARASTPLSSVLTISFLSCLLAVSALPRTLDRSVALTRDQALQLTRQQEQHAQDPALSTVISATACKQAATRLRACTLDKVDLYEPKGAEGLCCEPYEQLVELNCFW